MQIQKAEPSDHISLTALTKISKAHWDYSPEQIEKWSEVLTITEEFIKTNSVYKLCQDDQIVAYYAYIQEDPITVTLDSLFILPDFIGQGFGKMLMNDFLNRVTKEGIKNILLEADPNATTFYQRYNFEIIDQKLSDVPGRYLPIMKLVVG